MDTLTNLTGFTSTKMQGEIVSVTAYLLGISDFRFDEQSHQLDKAVIARLDQNKQAKIFRALSLLRTKCELNYKKIVDQILNYHKTLTQMPDDVPKDLIDYLYGENVNLYAVNSRVEPFIITINDEIKRRLPQIRNLYPDWVNWDYVKDIFIMPNGNDYQGIKAAASEYYRKQDFCPYKCYMNFMGEEHVGNILSNDIHFLTVIYKWHHDEFTSLSRVQDASEDTKDNISQFVQNSTNTIAVVDCENASPYAFYAMLKGLQDQEINKVSKIILIEDQHASSAWQIFNEFAGLEVEEVILDRVKEQKSLTDMAVATRICKEFYQGTADRFLLVSSDSDYWTLINSLPDAKFLIVLEHTKCGQAFLELLNQHQINYCYSDAFNSNDADTLRNKALIREVKAILPDLSSINLYEVLDQADRNVFAQMTDAEKDSFYKKHLSKLRLYISDSGVLSLDI